MSIGDRLLSKSRYLFFIKMSGILCAVMTRCDAHPRDGDRMPHDHYDQITLSGDFLSFALPAIGVLGHTHQHSDDLVQLTSIMIETGLVLESCHQLKNFFKETELGTRPNGYHSSFPSQHSELAFYGARLIHKNYGWEYGLPAYGLAALTAYSRVHGRYHHVRDVVAGAALALTIDYFMDQITQEIPVNRVYASYDPAKKKSGIEFYHEIRF